MTRYQRHRIRDDQAFDLRRNLADRILTDMQDAANDDLGFGDPVIEDVLFDPKHAASRIDVVLRLP